MTDRKAIILAALESPVGPNDDPPPEDFVDLAHSIERGDVLLIDRKVLATCAQLLDVQAPVFAIIDRILRGAA